MLDEIDAKYHTHTVLVVQRSDNLRAAAFPWSILTLKPLHYGVGALGGTGSEIGGGVEPDRALRAMSL